MVPLTLPLLSPNKHEQNRQHTAPPDDTPSAERNAVAPAGGNTHFVVSRVLAPQCRGLQTIGNIYVGTPWHKHTSASLVSRLPRSTLIKKTHAQTAHSARSDVRGWLVSLTNDTRQSPALIRRQQQVVVLSTAASRTKYVLDGAAKRSQNRSPKRAYEQRLTHRTHLYNITRDHRRTISSNGGRDLGPWKVVPPRPRFSNHFVSKAHFSGLVGGKRNKTTPPRFGQIKSHGIARPQHGEITIGRAFQHTVQQELFFLKKQPKLHTHNAIDDPRTSVKCKTKKTFQSRPSSR